METLGVIIGSMVFVLGLIQLYRIIRCKYRTNKCKTWEIGDNLILPNNEELKEKLLSNKKEYAILEGWSLNHLFISCHDNKIHRIEWNSSIINKSDVWRQNFLECNKLMGINPNFYGGFKESGDSKSEEISKKVNGISIDLMTEIECTVYLKQAIKEDDYVTAELIKKRMEKFR